jgi:hypothetical protein
MPQRPSLAMLLACLSGCGPVIGTPPVTEDPRDLVVEARVQPNRAVDVLFVVDNSSGMDSEQEQLRRSFSKFVNTLDAGLGGRPDLHVGVISTDLGASATGSATPASPLGTLGQGGCGGTGTDGRFLLGQATGVTGTIIVDIGLPDGTRQQNYGPGDLATTLSQMATLGATGCGFEQPLQAMRRALSNNQANQGFLRPDALLSVVFLTDEDDCSVRDLTLLQTADSVENPRQSFRCTRFGVTCEDGGTTPDAMTIPGPKGRCGPNTSESSLLEDPAKFRDFLVDLKGDPTRVLVSGIIGTPTDVAVETRVINGRPQSALAHSCTSEGVDGVSGTPDDDFADPGVRMSSFLNLFPDRNTSASICQRDYSQALEATARLIDRAVGTSCLSQRPLDVDPAPGLQVDCVVEDHVGTDVTSVPSCGDVATSLCWRLVPDVTCPSIDQLRLDVVRPNAPHPQTVTRARCRTQ